MAALNFGIGWGIHDNTAQKVRKSDHRSMLSDQRIQIMS